MENWLKNQLGSYKFWIFIVTLCYFAYAIYFLVYGLTFTVGLIFDQYVYNLVSKTPWWWMILYYGSEGLLGSVAGFLRVFAGCFATYAAYLFWRKGELAFPSIKKAVTKALFLEAVHFVSLCLSVIGSFVYYFSDEPLYYFDGTPALVYLLVAGVPLLSMILVVTPSLLNLRKKINQKADNQEITRWASITGVVYLFVVFWFNYSMSWVGVLIPYTTKAVQQFGLEFLLLPFNFISFVVTVFGLLLLAIFGLKITLPAIQKKPTQLNLQHISLLVTTLGSYFLFNVILYYFTGGYAAHPSVWYEVIGPLHNPYFWCLSFTFLGLAMILQFKTKKNKSGYITKHAT